MIERRTFLQSISAWLSSLKLFNRPEQNTPLENPVANPDGWDLAFRELDSDKALGQWIATPQSGDRHVAFMHIVPRPLGTEREVNRREVPRSEMEGKSEFLDLHKYAVYSHELDGAEEEDWENPPEVDHYVAWEIEHIPPTPEQCESAKARGRQDIINSIQFSLNGKRHIVDQNWFDDNGERIRNIPEGFVLTRGMTTEEQELADKRQTFSENPPRFYSLAHTTFGELWFGRDYPERVLCGYLAWKELRKYNAFMGSSVGKFVGADLVLDKSLKLREVRFENPNFPGDPKYNRVITMPDEAYA